MRSFSRPRSGRHFRRRGSVYELFAREFMRIFRGTTKPLRASRETVGSTSDELLKRRMKAAMKFIVEHSDN